MLQQKLTIYNYLKRNSLFLPFSHYMYITLVKLILYFKYNKLAGPNVSE